MNAFGSGQPAGGVMGGGGQQGQQQQQGPNQSQAQQLLAQMQMMAAAQQQQQQQQQQPQSNQQQPNGNANGMISTPQIPPQQLQQLQQNPMQMLQVITGQISNLQRQWQTVQAQPESQQKMEAAQQLAAQMKKMKAFHSQTVQILQRQQQQQQQQGQGQQNQNQNQTQGPQQQSQQNQQGITPAAAAAPTPTPTPGPGPGPQSAPTPQSGGNGGSSGGVAGEAASPAHNAQLAALQAFAQQQRIQAMHQQPSQQPSGQAQQTITQQGGVQQTPQLKADLLNAVRSFMASKGTPLPPDMPTSFSAPGRGVAPGSTNGETKTIDMQMLFQRVIQFGGSSRIEAQPNGWVILAAQLGLAVAPIPPNHQPGQGEWDSNGLPTPSFVAPRLAQFYKERFSSFEEYWMAKMKGQNGQQGQQQQQQQGQNVLGAVTNDASNTGAGANGANTGQINGTPDNQTANVTPQMAQESAKKAQELQAQLPQQLKQLQELVKSGKLDQQQASQRFMFVQNAARMAVQLAQAQAQAIAASGQNEEQQQTKPAISHAHSQPSTSSVQASAPAVASTPLQQTNNNDSKKPSKRSRKSSTKQSGENDSKPEPVASTSEPSINGVNSSAPSASSIPPNTAQIQAANVQAQQAARMLHQGITNSAQQIGAFTAIRTAQVQQMQGSISSTEIASVSQALAQVYARVLTQAQNAGQPLQVAAPMAFAAAQQESNKFPQIKSQNAQDIKDVQMTNPSDNGLAAPSSSRPTSSAGPVAIPPVGTTTTAPAEPVKPSKYKIEYLPIRRDVSSFGGWDLDSVEAQIGPILAGRGRYPRSVRELGTVDIEGLIMSLKSRVDIEVTYALNALFILTASVQAPGFNLLLSLCEDLNDELLDILEEAAFGRLGNPEEEHFAKDNDDNTDTGYIEPIAMPKRPLTHGEWIIGVLEDEDKNKIHVQRKRKVSKGQSIRSNGVQDSLNEIALMSNDVDEIHDDANDIHANGTITDEVEESDFDEEDKDDGYESISTTYYSKMARERELQRQADTAIVIVEILLNLSVVQDNHYFLNNEPRLYTLLMNIIAAIDHEEIARRRERENRGPETSGIFDTYNDEHLKYSTVFTASEALRIRKDILGIIGSLAGETSILTNLNSTTLSNLFDFLASFVYDASEIEQLHGLVYREMPIHPPTRPTPQNPNPPPPSMAMQPFTRKVPQHADLALEAFSSLGQPDVNRKKLGDTIEEERLIKLGEALIKLLPVSDMDFHMLKTEARLAFCERIAMTLFDIAYMGSGSVKRRLRHSPGTKGIVFRCIKRLMKIHKDFSQNPFSVLTRRLVETLRLLSDGENMFNRAPLLGFGMEGNSLASKTSNASNSLKNQRFAMNGSMNGHFDRQQDDGNLLIEEEESVVELMTVEGIDPTIISELEKML